MRGVYQMSAAPRASLAGWGQSRARVAGVPMIDDFKEIGTQLNALGAELALRIGPQAAALLFQGTPVAAVAPSLWAASSSAEQRAWFAATWVPLVWDWNEYAKTPIEMRIAASMGAIVFIQKALNDWRARLFDADGAARALDFRLTVPPPTAPSKNIVERGWDAVTGELGVVKKVALVGLALAGVALVAFSIKEASSS
jgi:hypothetical protein